MDTDADRRLVVLYGVLSEDGQCCLPCFSVTFRDDIIRSTIKRLLFDFQERLNKKY